MPDDEHNAVTVYNWAYRVYRAATTGGEIAKLDLGVEENTAWVIDQELAAIADAARQILAALHEDTRRKDNE